MSIFNKLSSLYRSTHLVQVPVLSSEGIVISYAKVLRNNSAEIDDSFSDYFKSIEDASYETNLGISIRGLLRALKVNYKSKRIVQGGSSITQQVVRIIFPCKFRILRKIYELPLAVIFTFAFGKRKILSFYINNLYLGKGIWGAGNALKLYFKDKLTPEYCLAIASLSTRPEFWVKNPAKLYLKSKNIALKNNLNLELEKLMIAAKRIDEKASTVKLHDDFSCLNAKRFDPNIFNHKEFKTSLSSAMTKSLVTSLEKYLHKFDVTVVVVDQRKFNIKAAVRFEKRRNVKRYFLTEKIRVGSLLKPFLVHCYVSNGFDANELFESMPLDILVDGKSWKVRNFKEKYPGKISLIDAVAISDNSVCVQALLKVGLEKFRETLIEFGVIDDSFKLYHSSILGSSDVGFCLQDLLRGYSCLMALKKVAGDPIVPHKNGIKVLPNEGVIQARVAMSRVLSEGTANTLKSLRLSGAKTGTDQNVISFIGYDPNYAVFVQATERQHELLETFGRYDDKSYSIFDMVKDVTKSVRQFIKSDEGKFEIYGRKQAA